MGRDNPDRVPGGLAASLVDQALLSGATFGVAAVFVAISSKTEFAIYSLIWVSIQLASSIQNAVVLTPFLANIPYLDNDARGRFVGSMGRFQLELSLVGGLVAFAVTLVGTVVSGGLDLVLAASAGIALLGGWAREFRRTRQFADLQPARALRGDILYVAMLAVLIAAGCLWERTLSAAWALSSWGIVGLFSGMGGRIRTDRVSNVVLWKDTLSRQVRWTLPSVVLSWVQANAYNFVALTIIGIHSVADANTARLLASPLSLLQAGWNRVFLPNAGAQVAAGRRADAVHSGGMGIVAFAATAALYAAALFAAALWWKTPGALHRVAGLEALILLWMLYQFVAGARGIGTSLMVVQASFVSLFRFGLVATVATTVTMLVTGPRWGLGGLLFAMIGGESLLAALTWKQVLCSLRAPRRATASGGPMQDPARTGEPSAW